MEKRFDFQAEQEKLIKKWQKEQTYKPKNNPGPLFTIDTPPPTVSGSLHIGHIFSYTQTDIIARYKRMNGHSVFYPFGFDDNGLPTERFVEKKLKIRPQDLGRSEFIKKCLEQTQIVEKEFEDLWQNIGLSVDWDSVYSTISEPVRRLSQESFIELLKKGYVYRKDEPAIYCTTCRTSVAQAELDDIQKDTFFNDIVFVDKDGKDLVISTTRPELLSSCVALFFHPDDARYKKLQGTNAKVPLFGFEVPILADETVEIEKGTGLVMCCTFGDTTDIEWFKKHKLPYKQSVGFNGRWIESTGLLAGLKAKEARATILEELKKNNLVLSQKPISHSVNVHERCKKEIEFVMLKQWFLNLLDYKKEFLALAEQIHWYPAFMKSRYKDWVQNLRWDWCLSRQRFYGIPFPIWYCKDCNEVVYPEYKDLPIDPQEQPFPGGNCPKCDCKKLIADTDVMDTWNTSSLSPYICLQLFNKNTFSPLMAETQEEFIPMGMRPQAHDIIRTWAFYTIVKTWFHNKLIPWKEIVISGHVLSDKKEKLSKSKGNEPFAPKQLLKRFPADAIRYWTSTGGLGKDIAFSETQIKIGSRLVTKIWNAFRFAAPHIQEIDPQSSPEEFGVVNEWILDQMSKTFTQYKNYFEKHEFSLALDTIEKFFWNTFCDNYLELIKPMLFNEKDYDHSEVIATQYVLYQVGLRTLQLFAPYLPFVTETIYDRLYKKEDSILSIAQTQFATVQTPYTYKQSVEIMETVVAIIGSVRKLKTDQQLSLKIPLAELVIFIDNAELFPEIKNQRQLIAGVTQAEKILFKEGEKDNKIEQKKGLWYIQVSN